jgi:diadenylate cyclase
VSQKEVRDRAIGLRHRAAMGVTEETDAIALIVSEESGALSIAYRGKLEHDLEPEELRDRLNELLTSGTPKKETHQEEPTRELGTP